MPFPVIPAIMAASAIGSAGLNSFSTGSQNRASQRFSEQMYDKQYQDNVAFWNMQNEYNHPAQQMARLKSAGLNPAMMYGGQGGAASSGQADKIQTPDVQSAQFRSPEWGNMMGGAATAFMDSMYNYDIKQAQIDNLKADNTVKLSQAALLAAQTGRSEFDLGFETELRDISAEARREQLRKMQIDNRYTLNEDERRAATTSQSLQESVERILNMRVDRDRNKADTERINKTIESISRDVTLKDLDIELRKMGINPQDPMWVRMLGRLVEHLIQTNNLPTRSSVLNSIPQGGNIPSSIPSGMGSSLGGKSVSWRKFILGY